MDIEIHLKGSFLATCLHSEYLMLPIPGIMDCSPVEQVENQKQKWKQYKECEVCDGICVLLPPEAVELPELHLEQDPSVLHQSSKHKNNTTQRQVLESYVLNNLVVDINKRATIFLTFSF